ncbi:MAG: photosystem I reaction center subunit IV, partial [Pseudomonadota bacterium]
MSRSVLLVATAGLVAFHGRSAEVPDQLETAAIPAVKAQEAALLDIVESPGGAVAVGERGMILALDADGWQQAIAPVSSTLTAAAFSAAGVGLAVGHDGVILRQEAPGGAWEKVADGNSLFPIVIDAARSRHKAAEAELETATDATREDLEFALEDALFRLETAEQSLAYGPAWPLLDVVFTDASTAWAAGAYGMLFRSGDAGATWDLVSDRLDNFEDL